MNIFKLLVNVWRVIKTTASRHGLLITLLISLCAGSGLSQLKHVNIDYQVKCLIILVVFTFCALFCSIFIKCEFKAKRKMRAYLIAILCGCMIVSSWFGYLFMSADMYWMLIDMKQGGVLNWANIYRSIELAALIIVGKNGVIYIYNWGVCGARWINAIIVNSKMHQNRE